MPKTFTIGQAAKATGVAVRTIRYYETAGVLAPPRRTASGYRLYTEARRARSVGAPSGLVTSRPIDTALDPPRA